MFDKKKYLSRMDSVLWLWGGRDSLLSMVREIVLNKIYSYILTIHMKKSQIRNGHLDS